MRRGFAIAVGLCVAAACGSDYATAPDVDSADAGPEASAPAPVLDAAVSDAPPGAPPEDAVADAGDASTTPAVVQIATGTSFACALLDDGSVWCWGDNSAGQLGLSPPTSTSSPPGKVPGLADVVWIAAGTGSTCVVKKDATVWCWGENTDGELGRNPEEDLLCGLGTRCQPEPRRVTGLLATSVDVGFRTTCAISTNATVICWGRNTEGQCGRAASLFEPPTTVGGLTKMTSVRLGYFGVSACAIDQLARLWCWGKNTFGQLGHEVGANGDVDAGESTGNIYNPSPTVVAVPDGGPMADVVDSVSSLTTCAIRSGGTVWCWGSNRANFLVRDAGDSDPHPVPAQIDGISGAAHLAIGNAVCALRGNGVTFCWGPSGIANGSPTYAGGCRIVPVGFGDCRDPARLAGPLLRAVDLDRYGAIGITVDGGVVGWGLNIASGLGHPAGTQGDVDSGTFENNTPTPVVGLP